MSTAPRVFISYSWDSSDHCEDVLEFAQRLRNEGVDARLDRFATFPEEGWPLWMEREIEAAAFVLVIATEKYSARFSERAPEGTGLGVRWEGAAIRQHLYDGGAHKFVPVTFKAGDAKHIPLPLRRYSRYCLATARGYHDLYRLLTNQPATPANELGAVRTLPPVEPHKAEKLEEPPIHHFHLPPRSNLPRLALFFGREREIATVVKALLPASRTWGVLIDGTGGIGKTALAIRSAELAPPGLFEQVVFLSAKTRELRPEGVHVLEASNGGYRDLLRALAEELQVWEQVKKTDDVSRADRLRYALTGKKVLLILDNVETLTEDDRDQLYAFLTRLPVGCKAIVTSRRRTDLDARTIRLARLERPAALEFIESLAEDRPRLKQATDEERVALYESTGGNPLLIRWVAGQLGRGKCRTVEAALKFLRTAPPRENALEFVFGDLVSDFTAAETEVVAALSLFAHPVEGELVAEIGGLAPIKAQAALEDLHFRALVNANAECTCFVLQPLIGEFVQRKMPTPVGRAHDWLIGRAYELVIKNGYENHARFSELENNWPVIQAAIPHFLKGDNSQLQAVCDALFQFANHFGHWDELLAVNEAAEERALTARDLRSAGWRACQAGWVHYLRAKGEEVMRCADRAKTHWKREPFRPREYMFEAQLRGRGLRMKGDLATAITVYEDAVVTCRTRAPASDIIAVGLNSLANTKCQAGDFEGAEQNYREASEIARKADNLEGVAVYTGNLAELSIEREQWPDAERHASAALTIGEKLGREQIIGANLIRLSLALIRQQKEKEAAYYAQRSLQIFDAPLFANESSARAAAKAIIGESEFRSSRTGSEVLEDLNLGSEAKAEKALDAVRTQSVFIGRSYGRGTLSPFPTPQEITMGMRIRQFWRQLML